MRNRVDPDSGLLTTNPLTKRRRPLWIDSTSVSTFIVTRSVIVRMSAAGEKLSTTRVANDRLAMAGAVAEAGPDPEVVVEATYGWYWVADLLQANGAHVHLANPQGLNGG